MVGLAPGDLLIVNGYTVHAGAAGTPGECEARLHVYIQSHHNKKPDNETWLVDWHLPKLRTLFAPIPSSGDSQKQLASASTPAPLVPTPTVSEAVVRHTTTAAAATTSQISSSPIPCAGSKRGRGGTSSSTGGSPSKPPDAKRHDAKGCEATDEGSADTSQGELVGG